MRANALQGNIKQISCGSRPRLVVSRPQRHSVVSNAICAQGSNKENAATFTGLHAAAAAAASNRATACRATDYRSKPAGEISVAVFGSTGYIGRKVTDEMISRGFKVTPVARDSSGIGGKQKKSDVEAMFSNAECRFTDFTDSSSIAKDVFDTPKDVVVCCLASRTGGIKDSWDVDYQATKNCMDAAVASGAKHFVLLSAICVQKPLLEFQKAKLQFEADLQANDALTYSIVRPTAFFKSLAGQVESVKKGGPYVMFGDGHLAACKPISEEDVAKFMGDCVTESDKVNQVLPVGGPGEALDPVQQSEILFKLLGTEPRNLNVPVGLMDVVIGTLEGLGNVFPNLKEAAEFGRIGKYYATESMLVYDSSTGKYDAESTPSYGETTLEMFFDKALKEGMAGQELGDQAVFGQK